MLLYPTARPTARSSPLIFILLCTLNAVSALGINCRGSLVCKGQDVLLGRIVIIADNINDSDIYGNNQHIVCQPYYVLGRKPGSFCLFMQGHHPNSYLDPLTGQIIVGVAGQTIKNRLRLLYSHGCGGCGSVPIGPNNDPNAQGILTVNYVGGAGCDGAGHDGTLPCTPVIPYYAAGNPLNAEASVLSSQAAAAQATPPPLGYNSSAFQAFHPTTTLKF
ncbi:hypothetical protein N7G274_008810 [Stereocaulon virgatum]|uniref:Killer toxin Kp4 domain-containing protein n=1 Tax=Stereocaulon virgatum TaxID=373712 RepID=A0ABR3ZZM4_9LECA